MGRKDWLKLEGYVGSQRITAYISHGQIKSHYYIENQKEPIIGTVKFTKIIKVNDKQVQILLR